MKPLWISRIHVCLAVISLLLFTTSTNAADKSKLADKGPVQLRRLMQGLIAAMEKEHALYPVDKINRLPVKPIQP